MGLLILRVAARSQRALNPWMTALACAGSAAVAALAMRNSFFLSLPVKALLLALMTRRFCRKPKSALRCGLCVLLSTCVMGGLAYMVAGAFSEGVLYADTSVRPCWRPFACPPFAQADQKSAGKDQAAGKGPKGRASVKEHSMTLRARSGHEMHVKGSDHRPARHRGGRKGQAAFSQEPGLAVQYTTVNGPGEMPAAVAGVRAAGGEAV